MRWKSCSRTIVVFSILTMASGLAPGAWAGGKDQVQGNAEAGKVTVSVLYNFQGPPDDGQRPQAGLARDKEGNLYGTTTYGGPLRGGFYFGVVFELDENGKESVLYMFTGGADGGLPWAPLIRDSAGNLYGTTLAGGNFENCTDGCGVVFRVDPAGNETVLHAFVGGTKDGCLPAAGLVRDSTGNLYGTTLQCGGLGYGIVFKLDREGNETVLHSFNGWSYGDGENPDGGLLLAKDGNLYGVVSYGGASDNGAVYRVSKKGKEALLFSFGGGEKDGCQPTGTPAMDASGNIYGTTVYCGSSNYGIVWELSTERTETVLHTFSGGSSDGASPQAGVILNRGVLYGDTIGGGASNGGTVFRLKLNKNNGFTLLHSFTLSNGEGPFGGLIRDTQGNLYGTSEIGGLSDDGTVWKLTP
jgi:uncharacterized repeat protein (TIGR03803 family)